MQRFEHGCIDDGDGNDSVIGFRKSIRNFGPFNFDDNMFSVWCWQTRGTVKYHHKIPIGICINISNK